MSYTINDYQLAAEFITSASPCRPKTAVVLGSGLGGFADRVENAVRIPYREIPSFPVSTAPSHKGEMILGKIGGAEVCVLSGRFHYYEGLTFEQSAFYVGALKLFGVENFIMTNAAGSINPHFNIGDLMLVSDHINFAGSPMRGENIDALGPRFFDMTDAYSAFLRGIARACAEKLSLSLKEGVYAFMTGPQYETPAEIRALSALGADAVGMSTVPEIIAVAHCGARALCISCLTNYAAGVTGEPLSSDEVTSNAAIASQALGNLIERIISSI